MEGPASYPPDVKVIRLKSGEKLAIQWLQPSGDETQVPHVREIRMTEADAEALCALRVLRKWFS